MADQTKPLSKRQVADQHEQDTGLCARMLEMGWVRTGRTGKGVPNEFAKHFRGERYLIKSTFHGLWRVARDTGLVMPAGKGRPELPILEKLCTPTFLEPWPWPYGSNWR